jgi:hypothetical protein
VDAVPVLEERPALAEVRGGLQVRLDGSQRRLDRGRLGALACALDALPRARGGGARAAPLARPQPPRDQLDRLLQRRALREQPQAAQRAARVEYGRRLYEEGSISEETYLEEYVGIDDVLQEQARKDREAAVVAERAKLEAKKP